jgi:hypothetical protein
MKFFFLTGLLLGVLSGLAQTKHKGVCWVGGREEVNAAHIRHLQETGVTWISQTPFGWQSGANVPVIQMNTGEKVWWGESDKGIQITTELARKQGIQTVLKPHLWLRQGWPGDIAMTSEADWQAWFDSYEKFILHYARLAQAASVDLFCVGTELQKTTTHEKQWRELIRKVREVYKGKLTYAANFHEEYEHIRFWDALDFIGIQAYFALSQQNEPSVTELVKGWNPHLTAIEQLHQCYQKPVLFTEIGYRSTRDAAIEPWRWPKATDEALLSEQAQANCYEAFFQKVWNKKWMAGVYFWKWYPKAGHRLHPVDFTPQQKKAEGILKKWFSL